METNEATASTGGVFGKAIEEFLGELREKGKRDAKNPFIQVLNSQIERSCIGNGLPQSDVSARELQRSISELDSRKRSGKGYRLLHRLKPFLEVFKNMMKKCEAFAQVAPFGVSVAFAGARIVLEMAVAVDEYLEVVVVAMEQITGILEIYQKLSASHDLGPRLVRSYKEIITFWYKLSKVLSAPKISGIVPRSILTPLKAETEDALKNLQQDMHVNLGISQAAGLVMAAKDRQERADADQRALRDGIRRWIMGQSSVDFRGDYENLLDQRHDSTCAWILRDQRFLDWRDARYNAFLWYNAQPGSGKSVLASSVIDHLTGAGKKTAYFFYSFSKNYTRYVINGLRILALQLLALVKIPSDKLVDLYEAETQFSPHLENVRTLIDVVHELMNRIEDLYIIIDGVDECEDEKDTISLLEGLLGRPTLGTVRWLFSSRVSDIEKAMRNLGAVEIQPSPEDIIGDINDYLSSKISCKHCVRTWTKECDTNFLMARFVSETLGKLTSEADITAELNTFPKKLNGYYTRALAKINARGRIEQLIARRIFLILSSAHQSITVEELLDALAIERRSQDHSTSRLPKEELIQDLCGSLVNIEKHSPDPSQGRVIRLCHKSVKDFFQQDPKETDLGIDESLHKYFVRPVDAHEELGLDCLTYLMYGRYSRHIDLGFLSGTIPKKHAFLRYAAAFWFQHLGDPRIDTPSSAVICAVRKFLQSKNFWNCLRVQSHVVPYLFGRYTRHRKGFQMAIRGREWKGEDGFAVPVPDWLSDQSPEDLLMDQSLCAFVDDWREVMIIHPDAVDQCPPLVKLASSCWLKSLLKTSRLKVADLGGTLGSNAVISSSRLLAAEIKGKKLCVDWAYRTKNDPSGVVHRVKQPLFKPNTEPQKSQQSLPVETDISNWTIWPTLQDDVSGDLVAWSVDPQTLDLRKTGRGDSERIQRPASTTEKERRTMARTSWEMLAYLNETRANPEMPVQVIHMSQEICKRMAAGKDEDDGDDIDQSDDSSESESESEPESDDYSDDDTSSSQGSAGDSDSDSDSAIGDMTSDESDLESHPGGGQEYATGDCLIIIPQVQGLAPYWTTPWRTTTAHPPLIWSRIVCAVHPTRPLVAFMRSPTQLDFVNLEARTQRAIKVSGLPCDPDDVSATVRGSFNNPAYPFLRWCLVIVQM